MTERPTFLVEQGITSDITGLFMRSNDATREMLLDAACVILKYLPSSESEATSMEDGFLQMPIRDFALDIELVKLMGPDEKNDWYISGFTAALQGMHKEHAKRIIDELRGIHIGTLTPTVADIQRMSNLSSGALNDYLYILGIDVEDIKDPVLDVGTGETAGFASQLLLRQPDRFVVSTSMHVGSKRSPMRSALSQRNDVGSVVAADGVMLPFSDETFMTVVSVNADPYYVPRRELSKSLYEKHRVLQVGGTALLCPAVCEYGNHTITQEDLARVDIDVDIVPMNQDAAKTRYGAGIDSMLVIRK